MLKNQKPTKPYQSKLIPHQKEIFRMWWSRKTLREIQVYLKKLDVQISLQGVSSFIKRRTDKPDPHYVPAHLKHFVKGSNKASEKDVSKMPTPGEYLEAKAHEKKVL